MFKRCNGLRLNGLTHVDSPRVHLTFTSCNGVIVSNLRIIAPETSPNTDGIDIANCKNVNIRDSVIGTGDDCIAISGGSSNIKISGIMCGPGHGIRYRFVHILDGTWDVNKQRYINLEGKSLIICKFTCSIGALGSSGVDVVENIDVRNCTMTKTLAGVRIKSWQVIFGVFFTFNELK